MSKIKKENIEKLREYDKKEYERACNIVEEFMNENKDSDTWTKEQVKAMKFQYAFTFKILAEEGSYILKNFWLNVANMDSFIKKCKH